MTFTLNIRIRDFLPAIVLLVFACTSTIPGHQVDAPARRAAYTMEHTVSQRFQHNAPEPQLRGNAPQTVHHEQLASESLNHPSQTTKTFLNRLQGIPEEAMLLLIRFYQKVLGPSRGGRCQFHPSCSNYALEAIRTHGAFMGTMMMTDRLMRCNPTAYRSGKYKMASTGHLIDPVEQEFSIEPDGATELQCELAALEAGRPFELKGDELLEFAHALYEKGSYELALSEFERFAFLFPDSPSTKHAREMSAFCHARQTRWREAARVFHEISVQSCDYHDKWKYDLLIGQCAARAGDLSGAVASFSNALNHLDSPLPHVKDELENRRIRSVTAFLMGAANLELGNYDVAEKYLTDFARESYRMGCDTVVRSEDESPARHTRTDEILSLVKRRISRFRELPERSPVLAGFLSALVPGAGQLYADRPGDALCIFLTNAAFIAGTIIAARNDQEVAAWCIGIVGSSFYAGNILGAVRSAHQHNEHLRREEVLEMYREMKAEGYLPEQEGRAGILEIYFTF